MEGFKTTTTITEITELIQSINTHAKTIRDILHREHDYDTMDELHDNLEECDMNLRELLEAVMYSSGD